MLRLVLIVANGVAFPVPLEHGQRNVLFRDALEGPVGTQVGAVQRALLLAHKRVPASGAPEAVSEADVNVEPIGFVGHEAAVGALEHVALVGGGLIRAPPQGHPTRLAVPHASHLRHFNLFLVFPGSPPLVGPVAVVHTLSR